MFERRGRRIRNLAKSLANLRKVANIICIDRDATRSRIRNSSFSKYFEQVGQLSTSEKLSVYCQIRWNCVVGKYCPVLSAMIYRSSTSKMHLILKCDNSIFHPTVIVPIVKPRMYLLDCVQYVNGPVEAKP